MQTYVSLGSLISHSLITISCPLLSPQIVSLFFPSSPELSTLCFTEKTYIGIPSAFNHQTYLKFIHLPLRPVIVEERSCKRPNHLIVGNSWDPASLALSRTLTLCLFFFPITTLLRYSSYTIKSSHFMYILGFFKEYSQTYLTVTYHNLSTFSSPQKEAMCSLALTVLSFYTFSPPRPEQLLIYFCLYRFLCSKHFSMNGLV